MPSSVIAAGLGLAAIGITGRYILRRMPNFSQQVNEAMKTLPNLDLSSNKYYKGGFDPKMNRREASLILGISPSSAKPRVKEAHKRLITINHPDRGGSPYLATKINEAKDYLENSGGGSSGFAGRQ